MHATEHFICPVEYFCTHAMCFPSSDGRCRGLLWYVILLLGLVFYICYIHCLSMILKTCMKMGKAVFFPDFAGKQIELEKLGTGGNRGNTSQLCLTPCP